MIFFKQDEQLMKSQNFPYFHLWMPESLKFVPKIRFLMQTSVQLQTSRFRKLSEHVRKTVLDFFFRYYVQLRIRPKTMTRTKTRSRTRSRSKTRTRTRIKTRTKDRSPYKLSLFGIHNRSFLFLVIDRHHEGRLARSLKEMILSASRTFLTVQNPISPQESAIFRPEP